MRQERDIIDNMASVAQTRFGQLVIGPPGSGKTTYVAAMSELLTSLGRKVAIVNLDPGNENMTYKPAVDVSELVTVEDVMDEMKLGPNGGLMHAMQFVRTNLDWLDSKLGSVDLGSYLILDCPGQVELYTVDSNMKVFRYQTHFQNLLSSSGHYRSSESS